MMKPRLLTIVFLALTCLPGAPAALAAAATPAEFHTALAAAFKEAPPELTRYDGLTTYGETFSQTRRSADSLHTLQALYADARRLSLLQAPDKALVELCHELIVYQTPEGMDCLRSLAQHKTEPVLDYLAFGIMAAGEAGEQLAIEHLRDKDVKARAEWSELLSHIAIYPSSVAPIMALAKAEKDARVKSNELLALAKLGDPAALDFVSAQLAASDDRTQAAAIFAYTELRGRDALPALKQLKPAGEAAKQELANAIDYLDNYTSPQSKFGTKIDNDSEFWDRFGDLKNPVVQWLNGQKHIVGELSANTRLTKEEKQRLFSLLEDSKGFGLEAVKGSLHASAERGDIEPLLRIRQSAWISPSKFSVTRMKSIDILIRSIRRELP